MGGIQEGRLGVQWRLGERWSGLQASACAAESLSGGRWHYGLTIHCDVAGVDTPPLCPQQTASCGPCGKLSTSIVLSHCR